MNRISAMNRISQYIAILKRESTQPLQGSHPADAHLRSLLVHTAFADGQVDHNEFELLRLLVPEKDLGELLLWVDHESKRPMDLDTLLSEFATPSDRKALVVLAMLMSRADGHVDEGEAQLVDTLKALIHF
jgi:uncharacterized membrane protein YebE (DUF533 family)